MYAKDKKYYNDQSDILNTDKQLLDRNKNFKSDLYSSLTSWETPNYKGETKTSVND